MRPTYQPELDGLRALAVSLVLIYHAGAAWLPGGYIGVDVFFVLSGFLITRILLNQLARNQAIDFGHFYLRRIRRLFPALLCTIVVSCIWAFLLLSPEQIVEFFSSGASAVLSMSNFFFWQQADYFDALATTKPLLHTWSLSVEEQFYLIWPFALLLLWRRLGRAGAFLVLLLLAVMSVLLAEWLLGRDQAAAFYLLPARMVELAIGALLVWMPAIKRRGLQEALLAVGVAMIIFSAAAFDEATPFPGFVSLVPCMGAAMFIVGHKAPVSGFAFRTEPVVWLGRISYSLYLVHWPVVVFFIAYTYRNPTHLIDIAVICSLSVILAWAQYELVEQRFRYPKKHNRKFVAGAALKAGVVAAGMFILSFGSGLAWRLPEERLVRSNGEWREIERETYCESWQGDLDKDLFTCQNHRDKQQDIFIWGDSHGLHLVAGFSEAFPEHNVHVLYMVGCVPQSGIAGYVRNYKSARTQECVRRNEDALAFFEQAKPTNIVVTSAKRSSPDVIARVTGVILDRLQSKGHNVVVLGDFMKPGVPLGSCVATPDYLIGDERLKRRCVGDEDQASKGLAYNRELAELLPETILPNDIQCPEGKCNFFRDDKLLYRDSHHLSVYGSIRMIDEMRHLIPIDENGGMVSSKLE